MPTQSNSLVPFTPTNFTATDGTTYKGEIDGNSGVAANISACFYVYPTSPALMEVAIDSGCNYQRFGFALNFAQSEFAGPSFLALTAPVSITSYWATVFWDVYTCGPGVVYTTAAGNTPIYPDAIWQEPIALVFLTNTTATITAANIHDVRSSGRHMAAFFTSTTANPTFNCGGATSISIIHAVSASSQITLTNLRVGVPIQMRISNNAGSAITVNVVATTPSGVTYAIFFRRLSVVSSFDANLYQPATGVSNIFQCLCSSYSGAQEGGQPLIEFSTN